jgi:hypothetical protein
MRVSLKESLCGINRTVVRIDKRDLQVVVKMIVKSGTEVVVS